MELLNKDLIKIDAAVSSAEECIRLAGDLFLRYGYVKEGYSEAVIEREKTYPTGLPGKDICIAIPHTNNKLVNQPAIGVIIPQEPVEFCMMGNKDQILSCEVIIPLVVKNSEMQLSTLKKMSRIIQDGDLLKKIKNARSPEEVLCYLKILDED
ncbi:MAG: system, galactitol-specific component [Firmicutes bacterium]|nr:system, galactitol-specific component [Bacillota bacterium]